MSAKRLALTCLLVCCFLSSFVASNSAVGADLTSWKYKLLVGDHFVYEYDLKRVYRGEDGESRTHASYESHVLVLGVERNRISVGFQRNRKTAELLSYKENGKDKLREELPKFLARMAERPAHFSEAMEFDSSGEPQAYWEVARESTSKLLFGVHEIEGLPANVPRIGDSWNGVNVLGLRFRYSARETIQGEDCARVEGTDDGETVHLRYWWCENSGLIVKLEFEGTYAVPGGTVNETAKFRLTEKRHGEAPESWLRDESVRDGAMRSLILSPWIKVDEHDFDPLSQASDPRAQSLALAYLLRNKSIRLEPEKLRPLLESADETVRRLADRSYNEDGERNAASHPTCALNPPKYPEQQFGTTLRISQGKKSTGHPYMMRVPGDYRPDKKSPLLIYLSGGGGFAIDGVNTAEETIRETDYLVLYPQAGDYWWKPEIRERVDALIQEVQREFNVDPDRVYIAGFSNGGTGAVDYAELWPQRFAAVVSLMGAGQCNEQVTAGLRNLQNLPLLFVHGDRDPRIPASCSRESVDALKSIGMKTVPSLHILQKREHDITLQTDDHLTLPFLANKSRIANPKKFTASWSDLSFPRRYWVELMEKGSGTAEVSAEINENEIEITTRGAKHIRLLLRSDFFSTTKPFTVFINKKKVFEGSPSPNCRLFQESASRMSDTGLAYDQALEFDVSK